VREVLFSVREISCWNCFNAARSFNPLNTELNPIYYLLALLEAHHILHVSRIRVKCMSVFTYQKGWNFMWGPAKIWPTLNLLKWWKSWKSSQRNQRRSSSDHWWDFWDNWFVLDLMSANVNRRFEYEMCFRKIRSGLLTEDQKEQSFECLLWFKGTRWKWPTDSF